MAAHTHIGDHIMKKVSISSASAGRVTGYPVPYDGPCEQQKKWLPGDAVGFPGLDINCLHLPPGFWSSQRHWRTTKDGFVYMDLQGRTDREAVVLEIGVGNPERDEVEYPDIDLAVRVNLLGYVYKDGALQHPIPTAFLVTKCCQAHTQTYAIMSIY